MKRIVCWVVCWFCVAVSAGAGIYEFPAPERQPGQRSMLGYRDKPIPCVRVAFIGVGVRGGNALKRFAAFPENAAVKVACDLYQTKLDRIQAYLAEQKYPHKVDYYTGADDWKKICLRDDIDLVYVATPPDLHVPVALHAMKNGKHVALEVPAARTVADCWRLVDVSEQTRRHCIMLENCCYGDYELAVMNMIEKGMFGIPVHAEAGYLHNMEAYRLHMKNKDNWRRLRKPDRNPIVSGNPYPTHGLGPISHWMGINHGDRMVTLSSFSSGDFTLREAVREIMGSDTEYTKGHYEPDMNMSIIRTARNKTMLVFYSVSLRRPYSRAYVLNGTRGFTEGYPRRFAFAPKFEEELTAAEIRKLIAEQRHPVYGHFQKAADFFGGHGGMDTVMDLRLIYCLNNGLPLDISVYDGALWSAVSEISLQSVRTGGAAVAVPDFTRGEWQKTDHKPYQMLKPGKNVRELKMVNLGRKPEDAIAPVGLRDIEFTDAKGDQDPDAPVDFIGGSMEIRNRQLLIRYASAAPIDSGKISYHVKTFLNVGEEGGYDGRGCRFLIENWKLYSFDGSKKFQWKWKKIADVKMFFQKNECRIEVPLPLILRSPDRLSIRFQCKKDCMPDKFKAAPVLVQGNLAMDPGISIRTSPSRKGYDARHLVDGQTSSDIVWSEAAWASQEDQTDKFVEFSFRSPEKVSRLNIYWEAVSKEMLIQIPDGQNWKTAATILPMADEKVSKVQMPDHLPAVRKIRCLQKTGKGPADRPDLVWIREIEIY